LTKLQPFLDQKNIQRTVPDLAAFRTAHRFLRSWAKQRGIYAAKFGYLAGIHITMMLSRVCKLLFRNAGTITAADIIATFFRHYADFDWDHEFLYDPIFFKARKPKYRRYVNEPMVILTLFPPVINVARAVSVPSGRTIVEELKRVAELLEQPDMTWSTLSGGAAADEFLKSYSSYVKVNVRYWGISLSKGSALLGWLESRCLRLLVGMRVGSTSIVL
jgi:poly(A) polymerase Pap1